MSSAQSSVHATAPEQDPQLILQVLLLLLLLLLLLVCMGTSLAMPLPRRKLELSGFMNADKYL